MLAILIAIINLNKGSLWSINERENLLFYNGRICTWAPKLWGKWLCKKVGFVNQLTLIVCFISYVEVCAERNVLAYMICVLLQGWNHAFCPLTWKFDVQGGDCTWSGGFILRILNTLSLVILGFIWSHVQCCSLIFITSLDWLLLGMLCNFVLVKVMMLVDQIYLCPPHVCFNLVNKRNSIICSTCVL